MDERTRQMGTTHPGIEGALAAVQTGTAKEDVTLELHDLQGNIVATVEDSETATKLAASYTSTEFGAPNSKGEPPKYAYQGASGLTSEGSTGRIVQDGITYVPQTGAMLQPPEDLAPATPTNHNTAYVSNPSNPADEAGAQFIGAQIAKHEQENREREEAAHPAGVCTGEIACCEPDPEHGVNVDGCEVGASVWSPASGGQLTYEGKYHCEGLNVFELDVYLYERQPNGSYVENKVAFRHHDFHNYEYGMGGYIRQDFGCKEVAYS